MGEPTKSDILEAADRIDGKIHHTPVLINAAINEICDATVIFKCENLQKVGAFKMRGATNAVEQLTHDERTKGVITHSSGNHAQALAKAAKNAGIKATIVMPNTAPMVKQHAVRGYGAEIIYCEPTLTDREATVARIQEETGAVLIHPYNDHRIICGQATAGLELIKEEEQLDYILTPVGGGGLLSGTALSAHYFGTGIQVIGCEPEQADDAKRSFETGLLQPMDAPDTVADGLRTALGEKGFEIIKEHVHDILTVSEEEIVAGMRLFWERTKLIIEPSSAVPLAVLIKYRDKLKGDRFGIILSGGNVDVTNLPF